jgi:predicted nuclease of predicted toxin-antitoxin system
MRLLIDNALSPQIALALRENGYDAIHVRDISLHAVPDELVFAEAERDDRVIVSLNTDFTALLVLRES